MRRDINHAVSLTSVDDDEDDDPWWESLPSCEGCGTRIRTHARADADCCLSCAGGDER